MGPTAAGKTALAVELVRRLPCDIVSVDSAMVYRGMDIGTAKPGPETLAIAPHRLIDILEPTEAYSAARFVGDARREIDAIRARGRVPLLVGGTMLYFHALRHGLAPLPAASAELRRQIGADAAERGWVELHRDLGKVDPEAAARIHPHDPQRIQRALEVYYISGRPLSAHLSATAREPLTGPVVQLAVAPGERARLHRRIEQRLGIMFERGFVAEVEHLRRNPDLSLDVPSMRCVGYRQVWEYLDAKYAWPELRRRAIVATRRLAKRQLTWLRAEPRREWLDPEDSSVLGKMLNRMKQFGIPGT